MTTVDKNLIIGTTWYCTHCILEHMELIDQNGISNAEFSLYKRYQVCEECKSKNFLEFFPIYKGEEILEVTNRMARENCQRERKFKQEQNINWEKEYDRHFRKEEIKIAFTNKPTCTTSSTELEPESLDVPDKDYAEFTIRTIKKTVKREDVLVRQVFYTGLSTYTFDPINLGIIAPTSEANTYAKIG